MVKFAVNHNYDKILKSDWLSTALISTLIGQYASFLSNWTVHAITRAPKWLFFIAGKKLMIKQIGLPHHPNWTPLSPVTITYYYYAKSPLPVDERRSKASSGSLSTSTGTEPFSLSICLAKCLHS